MTPAQTHPSIDLASLTLSTLASADQLESDRRLPEELLLTYRKAGLWRLALPGELGGQAMDAPEFFRLIESLAEVDASAAWLVMVQNHHAHLAAYASEPAAHEIWGQDPDVLLAGSHGPRGRAVQVDGGYLVSGQFPYASGIAHARWLASGARLYDGDQVRRGADGQLVRLLVLTPVEAATVLDTWTTTGLRGTGSHDYVLDEVFVPDAYVMVRGIHQGRFPGPLYARWSTLFLAHGAHALGVARGALDALIRLVSVKPTRSDLPHQRDRVVVQVKLAEAEALLASARAYYFSAVDQVWRRLLAGEHPPGRVQAHGALAQVHAIRTAVQVVEQAYYLAGGTGVYACGEFDRRMRDIHTASAHLLAAVAGYEQVGRALLGLDDGSELV